jgi:hypothetical protein
MHRMEGERCRFARHSDRSVRRSLPPAAQRWDNHFVLQAGVIEQLTAEGKATARLLKLNLDKRIAERRLLAAVDRYKR